MKTSEKRRIKYRQSKRGDLAGGGPPPERSKASTAGGGGEGRTPSSDLSFSEVPADFLFITDQAHWQTHLNHAGKRAGVSCLFASTFNAALTQIDQKKFNYIFVDTDSKNLNALRLLEWLQTRCLASRLGVLSRRYYSGEYLKAIHLGVTEGFSPSDLSEDMLAEKLAYLVKKNTILEQLTHTELAGSSAEEPRYFVGGTEQIRQVLEQVTVLCPLPVPTLLVGPKGVGKKILGNHIARTFSDHTVFLDAQHLSDYEQKKVLIHALQDVQKNAKKTGQRKIKVSLLIHEIGNLYPELQESLADYFKTSLFEIGELKFHFLFKVIATTQGDLSALHKTHGFREDLTFMLRENSLHLPPLKHRTQDIPLLAHYFLRRDFPGKHYCLCQDVLKAFQNHAWPENILQLRQVIAHMAGQSQDSMLTARLLPVSLIKNSFYTQDNNTPDELTYAEAKKRTLKNFNSTYIADVIEKSQNNLTVAAELAGMDRSNFKKIIKQYGFMRDEYDQAKNSPDRRLGRRH